MPKRAVYSDKVFRGSLPFAPATIAGGFMFVCCVGLDRARQIRRGRCAQADPAVPRQHPRADRGGRRHHARHRQVHGLCHRPRQLAADERGVLRQFHRRPAAPGARASCQASAAPNAWSRSTRRRISANDGTHPRGDALDHGCVLCGGGRGPSAAPRSIPADRAGFGCPSRARSSSPPACASWPARRRC